MFSVKEACSLLAAVGGGWPLPSLCHGWAGTRSLGIDKSELDGLSSELGAGSFPSCHGVSSGTSVWPCPSTVC